MEKMPKLYVEVPKEGCIENNKASRDCLIIMNNVEVWLRKGESVPEFIDVEKAKFLAKEVYDRFYLHVDRLKGRMEVDAVLVLPDGRTRIYLRKGDELLLLPVEGYTKTLIANVGNRVRTGDAFAAVTTKKGEVHYLKPPKTGTVVFIDEITNRPHYVYYILPEE
ncbi:conserved hypothetical membrane protein [Thermococcus onnurineus NA1]|uniref:Conserved hypothetical membrane protein n=1 Tax=Thermococcus onnurineus (strain NA1) TaxID=523850 RepID=B6YUI5_THEON|nr:MULTISPECIES: DUF2118 domain-containing protein [Thermococcus]ACJ17170.1 conserved hypothetical membrane protein [Thermococcus onnurineus NA1]NJE46099.1 DUF2118 domain-containing protein [Thermococcus sp. GR7]NJE78265.1 DUF2118 domain-containing protein [Thermococcus sp. GR4]NJF22296.1 DUF2118 domain-containing protein [Thermococcus sp. GR5]